MQNEINFDNYVKDMLHNHKSPVPNGLWDKIVAEKDTKKTVVFWWTDKRWYMLAAACLILICGTCLVIMNKNNTDEVATKSQVPDKQANQSTQSLKPETIDSNTTLKQNNTTTNNNLNDTTDASNNSNLNNNATVKQLQPFNNTTKYSITKNKGNNAGKKAGSLTNQDVQNLPINNDNNQSLQSTNDNFSSSFVKANTVSLSKLFSYNTKDISALKLANQNRIFGLDCPNDKPATWYLEAYGSADYTMKNIFAYGVSNSYLQRIDSTTKMTGGFTAGIRLSKTINDNFLIKSGLQYTQRNEQFTSKSDSIITTTSVVTVRTIIRGGGLSDTTVRDTATLQQIGYRKRITNNHYKSIEIPLLLSYERGNDQWRFAINGGIIANLTSWYNGETLDTSYQLVPLSAKSTNGFYKSNLNLSLYAGVSIMRRLSDKMEAFAEPYFRYGISNTNTSEAGYSQRFNAVGLSLGIRYKLNNKGSGLSN